MGEFAGMDWKIVANNNRSVAAEAYGSYSAELDIRLEKYNIQPIGGGYYYCDILDEQIFIDKLKDALRNTESELTVFVDDYIKPRGGLILWNFRQWENRCNRDGQCLRATSCAREPTKPSFNYNIRNGPANKARK